MVVLGGLFSWGVASLPEGKSRCLGLVQFLGLEGEITASHLSVLRIRILAEAKESTAVVCCLQSAKLVERV